MIMPLDASTGQAATGVAVWKRMEFGVLNACWNPVDRVHQTDCLGLLPQVHASLLAYVSRGPDKEHICLTQELIISDVAVLISPRWSAHLAKVT